MAMFLKKAPSLLNIRTSHIYLATKHIHLTCIQLDQSNSSDDSKRETEDSSDIKTKILEASLPFVYELGWTKNALSAGAESLGFPGTTHGLFQGGGADLVHHFYALCNQQLAEKLKKETEEVVTDPTRSRPAHIFVNDALRFRLHLILPYLSTWPQAMGLMALPHNTPRALANLLTMVDDVCYYAGDRSIDITWYSRRIGLAGIYKLTELYLLQDTTPEHEATWQFLTRRLEEAQQLQALLENSGQVTHVAKDIVTGAFTTARNILGLNWNR